MLSPTDAVALSGIVGEGVSLKNHGHSCRRGARTTPGLVSLKFAVAVAMGTMVFTAAARRWNFCCRCRRYSGGFCGQLAVWALAVLSRWAAMNPRRKFVLLFLLPFASYLDCRAYWRLRHPRPRLQPPGFNFHHPFCVRAARRWQMRRLRATAHPLVPFNASAVRTATPAPQSLLAAEADPNVETRMFQ